MALGLGGEAYLVFTLTLHFGAAAPLIGDASLGNAFVTAHAGFATTFVSMSLSVIHIAAAKIQRSVQSRVHQASNMTSLIVQFRYFFTLLRKEQKNCCIFAAREECSGPVCRLHPCDV